MPDSEVSRPRAEASRRPSRPPTSRRAPLTAALACAALLLATACSDASSSAELPAVPQPDWSTLDPAVQAELQQSQQRLDGEVAAGVRDAALGRRFGEQGRRYEAYELRDAALACYEIALRLDAEEARWPYVQGRLHRARGESQQSVDLLERTLALAPGYLPAWVALGEVHLERADLDAAEDALGSALEVDERCAAALFALGRLESARQDWDRAIGHFEEALRLAPGASAIHYPLGLAYRAQGDTERARLFLERRGPTPPPLADPYLAGSGAASSSGRSESREANQALQEGRIADAAQLFRSVVEADPADVGARLNLAAALIQLDDLAGARAEYEAVLLTEPDQPMARTGRGWLLAQEGRDVEAVDELLAAIAAEPDLVVAHLYLADTLATMGVHDQAAVHFGRVVELDPRELGARYNEALSLLRAGRWAEARAAFERARQVLPQEQPLANGLARLLCCSPDDAQRDGPMALGIAEALVAADPRVENLEVLAMALAEVGRFSDAVSAQSALVARTGPEAPPRFAENLLRYEAGEPCRRAWPEVDPVAEAVPGASAPGPR